MGRRYAGRVLQLITGSTGLDDWEWGVTLLADDPAEMKEIVYEMRFDEVSARYAEFGPFFVGLVMEPAGRARARRHARRGLIPGSLSTRSMVTGRESASSTGQWRSAASASSS